MTENITKLRTQLENTVSIALRLIDLRIMSAKEAKKSHAIAVPVTAKDVVREDKKRPCLIYQDFVLEKAEKLCYITFTNYFCAFISIQAKSANDSSYFTVVPRYTLMNDPHYSNDAQNTHTIHVGRTFRRKPIADTRTYQHIRILFFQPSPNWKNFNLQNVKFYVASPLPTKSAVSMTSITGKNYKAEEGVKYSLDTLPSIIHNTKLLRDFHSVCRTFQTSTADMPEVKDAPERPGEEVVSLFFNHHR